MPAKVEGAFIEPMLLLRTDRLPDDASRWEYQLKLDGYRAVAFNADGRVHLQSRNGNDFGVRYAPVLKGLAKLPADTVIDGEIVALDADGRPSFNRLRNYGSADVPLAYFVFDVMVLRGRSVVGEPLSVRRGLLESKVLPKLREFRSHRGCREGRQVDSSKDSSALSTSSSAWRHPQAIGLPAFANTSELPLHSHSGSLGCSVPLSLEFAN